MRDLQYFARELELDESTRAIVGTLLRDYVETYEGRAAELKNAIREARRSGVRDSMLARASRASDTGTGERGYGLGRTPGPCR